MPIAYALKNMIGVSERYRATSSPIFVELFRKAKNSRLLSMVFRCQKKIFILYCQLEMAWDVKRPVFGPSAKVLKQSAINSLAVTSFQAAEVCSQIRRKFIFHKLSQTNNKIFLLLFAPFYRSAYVPFDLFPRKWVKHVMNQSKHRVANFYFLSQILIEILAFFKALGFVWKSKNWIFSVGKNLALAKHCLGCIFITNLFWRESMAMQDAKNIANILLLP